MSSIISNIVEGLTQCQAGSYFKPRISDGFTSSILILHIQDIIIGRATVSYKLAIRSEENSPG